MLPAATRVVAYFDVPTTPVFTLDDPVAGKLDDTTYVLAGDIATDITSDVVSVSTKRGRSRWLDEIQVGTCSFTVRNLTRDYDPTGAGLYSANIVPGKRIQIDVGGAPVFDGVVDDWDLSYTLGGDATATAVVSDTLSRIGRMKLSAHTATSELSGARVNAVLDRAEVDFPAGQRDVDTGLTTLQADTVAEGTDVLTYLKLVARTESGRLFAARNGVLTFRERSAPVPVATVEFRDDGSGLPFDELETTVGSELLYNRAVVTRVGGTPQVENNTASQALYDIRTVEQSGLLFNSDLDAESLAEFLVNKYGTPEFRVSALGVNIARLSTVDAVQVSSLELGDVVRVVFSPPGGGTAIDRYGVIEGVEHRVGIDSHRVMFRMSSLQETPFVLDSTVFGVLDGDTVLAY
jgi:hypothetical protein